MERKIAVMTLRDKTESVIKSLSVNMALIKLMQHAIVRSYKGGVAQGVR